MEANAPCSTHWIELQPGFVLRFQRQCLSEPTQLQTVRKDCRERKTTGIIIPISWTARNGAGFWVLAILTCHLFQGSALGLVVFLILLGRQWVDCGRWTAASCREMIKKKNYRQILPGRSRELLNPASPSKRDQCWHRSRSVKVSCGRVWEPQEPKSFPSVSLLLPKTHRICFLLFK